jgi:hypothetical protein
VLKKTRCCVGHFLFVFSLGYFLCGLLVSFASFYLSYCKMDDEDVTLSTRRKRECQFE